ncbi:MAG: hypothetical protein ACJAR1_000256 [Rubritalea sp.]|jgi:hypothetical protein
MVTLVIMGLYGVEPRADSDTWGALVLDVAAAISCLLTMPESIVWQWLHWMLDSGR